MTAARDEGQRIKDQGQTPKAQPQRTRNLNCQLLAASRQQPTASDQQPATGGQISVVLRLLALLAFGIGAALLVKDLRRPPPPPSGEPRALTWLSESDAAMNKLNSVRLLRTTRGDSGGVLTETMTFQAPDLFYSQISSSYNSQLASSSSESISSGTTQYFRRTGESLWQAVNRVEPFRFPDFEFGQRAVFARLAGVEEVQGRRAQSVTYTAYEGKQSFAFKRWVDVETKLIVQEYMDAPGHHMLSVYSAYNAPVAIAVPSPSKIGPTPTAVTP